MRLKNPRKKGNHNRNLCRTELEKEGWLVGIVERTGRFVSADQVSAAQEQ